MILFWIHENFDIKIFDFKLHIEVIRQVRDAWGSVDISVRRVLIWEGLRVVVVLPSWCSRDKENTIPDPPTWKGISWNFRI